MIWKNWEHVSNSTIASIKKFLKEKFYLISYNICLLLIPIRKVCCSLKTLSNIFMSMRHCSDSSSQLLTLTNRARAISHVKLTLHSRKFLIPTSLFGYVCHFLPFAGVCCLLLLLSFCYLRLQPCVVDFVAICCCDTNSFS